MQIRSSVPFLIQSRLQEAYALQKFEDFISTPLTIKPKYQKIAHGFKGMGCKNYFGDVISDGAYCLWYVFLME